jgi:hypothetical protein
MTNTVLGFCNVPHISPLGVYWVSVFLLMLLSGLCLLEASLHRMTTCVLLLSFSRVLMDILCEDFPMLFGMHFSDFP